MTGGGWGPARRGSGQRRAPSSGAVHVGRRPSGSKTPRARTGRYSCRAGCRPRRHQRRVQVGALVGVGFSRLGSAARHRRCGWCGSGGGGGRAGPEPSASGRGAGPVRGEIASPPNAMSPTLLVIAGPNGYGKTTVTVRLRVEHWSECVEYIESRRHAGDRLSDWNSPGAVLDAARWAEQRREELLAAGAGIAVETVYSAPEKVKLRARVAPRIDRAASRGCRASSRSCFRRSRS